MASKPVIVWFRSDLRLSDHRALRAAIVSGRPILPVFIHDTETPGDWVLGGASRWWLQQSLAVLGDAIAERGNQLILRKGRYESCLLELAKEIDADEIYFSRSYEPWAGALEDRLQSTCGERGIELRRFSGALLVEPDKIKTKSGDPYRVYTPFWRALSESISIRERIPAPKNIPSVSQQPKSATLDDLDLYTGKPDWAEGLRETWQPGEAGAKARLDRFLDEALARYGADRDRPDIDGTSKLSPHLHFGEISPHEVWRRAEAHAQEHTGQDKGLEVFFKELAWREFSYHQLFHFPKLPEQAMRENFRNFPWRRAPKQLEAWQKGKTGYPIVDAGMRELWQTGFMHNRVRMIVASFLIKHLLLPWQQGEAWFWDTLVDADLANNAASWQWVAGSGADAAPYFRIFNPMLQGAKFDPNGDYVRQYVPEIAELSDKHIHTPWTASSEELNAAGVTLGETYPEPIVDHDAARARALAAYDDVKQS